MASLRSQGLPRLLRSAPAPRLTAPLVSQRFQSSVAKRAQPDEVAPRANQPDYDLPADKATSTFTPVPKQIQDGTEDVLPAAVTSGAPMELQARTVRIFKESKPATQSGTWRGHDWRMDWDILPKGHRWENPLMGWQSSGDFMQGTHMNFETKEDAIHFAEKQGYEYFVQEPNSRKFTPKAYANNFLYSPKKLKHIRTK
ncbi:ndufs4 NADH dehydrogenase Fe-S protein subunit [Lecanicillium sp. MT-2017a]|nr:ndufs4 NADH dehydrogenase Fe-S protein subunit [Lecanicillium sp. MT-2017a]